LNNKTTEQSGLLDKLAISLSSLCVIHCLAMPFVIILLPTVSHFFTKTVEFIIIGSVLPVSLAGFLPVWVRHKNMKLMRQFISGLSLLLVTQVLVHIWGSHDDLVWISISVLGTSAGAVLMAISIYKNRRHTHVCKNPYHDHEHEPEGI
jgi:hypothetical protein